MFLDGTYNTPLYVYVHLYIPKADRNGRVRRVLCLPGNSKEVYRAEFSVYWLSNSTYPSIQMWGGVVRKYKSNYAHIHTYFVRTKDSLCRPLWSNNSAIVTLAHSHSVGGVSINSATCRYCGETWDVLRNWSDPRYVLCYEDPTRSFNSVVPSSQKIVTNVSRA